MGISGLIYDHDGTLIDSIDLVVEATNAALLKAGLPAASREAVVRGMTLPTLQRLASHSGSEDAAFHARLASAYNDEAWRIGHAATSTYAGVRELLESVAARGLRQGMLSNNQGRLIRSILAAHSLDRWLAPILGEEDVPAPKPAGEGILAIAATWGLAAGEVVLVGDSSADAGAARSAGCRAVGVTWGTHPRAELLTAGFDALIDHPEQLPGLLAGWT